MEMMKVMIDIHNHVLINVDDGPKTKEDMLKLKQGQSEGVTEIIVTPHHLSSQFDNNYEKVNEKLQQIIDLDEVKELGITLLPGQEIRISDQILPQLRKGEAIGLNHSRYLLIEFPSRGFLTIRNVFSLNYNQKGTYPSLHIQRGIRKLVKI